MLSVLDKNTVSIFLKMAIKEIVKEKLRKYSATILSEWSHSFKGWIETENGKTISYDYAPYLDINDL